MKKFFLIASVAIFTMNISTSLAKIVESGTCGTNCNWALDDKGNMKITGGTDGTIGTMDNYSAPDYGSSGNTPWWNYNSLIKSVDIQGVENIGKNAFKWADSVTDINIGNTVESVGDGAFFDTSITSLYIPDSINEIGGGAFLTHGTKGPTLQKISLPDSINGLSGRVFGDNTDFEITCRGNATTCANVQSQLENYEYYNYSKSTWDTMNLSDKVTPANNEEQCSGSNHYWSGSSCNNKKNGIKCAENYSLDDDNKCIICNKQGYKNVGGYCNRIRYTPAEASAILHNDNTNEVTITFKK